MIKRRKHPTNIYRAIFIPCFLILLLCFVWTASASAAESVTIKFYAGQVLTCRAYYGTAGGYTQQLKVRVNGQEEDVPWPTEEPLKVTIGSDGTAVEFFNVVTDPNGDEYRSQVTSPAGDDPRPFPPAANFSINFRYVPPNSPGAVNVAQVECAVTPKIEVRCYNDKRETTIYPGANYPELAIVTFVAEELYAMGGGKGLYRGSGRDISIRMSRRNDDTASGGKYFVPCLLKDLNKSGLSFSNLGNNNEHALSWKGLFYAVGVSGLNSFERSISYGIADGSNIPEGAASLDIEIGAFDPVAVGVYSWNWTEVFTLHFDLKLLTNNSFPYPVELKRKDVDVGSRIDNVDFVREEIYKLGGAARAHTALCGDNHVTPYEGDPGPFILKLGDKTLSNDGGRRGYQYYEIYSVLLNAERKAAGDIVPGPSWPESGSGEDWLQVAATARYSQRSVIYNCVWECLVSEGKYQGFILTGTPYRVCLHPTNAGYGLGGGTVMYIKGVEKKLRLNQQPDGGTYGFFADRARDSILDHESVHSYQFLRGMDVYDLDGDNLYVNGTRGQNRYLKFSFDSKTRGFVVPDSGYVCEVDRLRFGRDGDQNNTYDKQGQFVTLIGIDAQKICDGAPGVEFPTDIPSDIPDSFITFKVKKIFLYQAAHSEGSPPKNIPSAEYPLLNVGCVEIVKLNSAPLDSNGTAYVKGVNGEYKPMRYILKINPYTFGGETERADILDRIAQGYNQIAILYEIIYKDEPLEYDASNVAIMTGIGG